MSFWAALSYILDLIVLIAVGRAGFYVRQATRAAQRAELSLTLAKKYARRVGTPEIPEPREGGTPNDG